MRDTSCLALWVIGRHLEMKGAACWTNRKQEQLHIWAAWREECWGGGAWQELSWWECPDLLANACLKSKCLLCSRWWSASFSPALGSCLEHTATLYQSRGRMVRFGAVIQRLKVTRTVQPLEGYSGKCLWLTAARLDSTVMMPSIKMFFFAYFCNSEEPLAHPFGKRYSAKLKGKYLLTVVILWFQYVFSVKHAAWTSVTCFSLRAILLDSPDGGDCFACSWGHMFSVLVLLGVTMSGLMIQNFWSKPCSFYLPCSRFPPIPTCYAVNIASSLQVLESHWYPGQ